MAEVITKGLVALLRDRFRLDWKGIHGAAHWSRVRQNGLLLAERSGQGASLRVVELFAFLHDSCRHDDGYDPMHGSRAAESIGEIAESLPQISSEERSLLAYACTHHSDGMTKAELTVQICWDADRLDLGRVGHRPDPKRLCTPAARDEGVIRWAYERSLGGWKSR